MEVESPATLKHLTKARQRNELLSEKLSTQNERCRQLEEQIRKSDEHSCNLQHKVTRSDWGNTLECKPAIVQWSGHPGGSVCNLRTF